MKIKVSHVVEITHLTDDQYRVITKGLSLLNPAYQAMKRQGNMRALYAIPEYIKYYKKTEDGLIVGRGIEPRLRRHFSDCIDDVCIDLSTQSIDKCQEFKCDIDYRDYQTGVIEEVTPHIQGIIRIDTGWGKSIAMMKLIAETQLKTLIVVPRLNLLRQFKSDIKKHCGYECGIINGPTFNVKDVTVATIQTLKKRNLKDIRSYFGQALFDEAHTYISDKGMKIVQSFNPLRLYGLTATADRSDGQGEAIKFMFGDIIVDRKLPFQAPSVEIIKCSEEIWGDTYPVIIDSQVDNINRNKLIANKAMEEVMDGRKILILTKRTKHYDELIKLIDPNIKCYAIKSKLNSADQKIQDDLLAKLRDGGGDFDIILGTFGLLSTGINIPALDTIIFAGDLKSSVLATQSVGRILRLFEGKQSPKIIDIDDTKSGILHNQARLRKNFYKSNEWEII